MRHFVLAGCLMVAAAGGATRAADPVRSELIADTRAVVPGRAFTVAARMDIDPGWHMYWMHPGDSGVAPTLEFEWPAGFEAGDLQWPLPRRFEQPLGAVGYGYEKQWMLGVRVTPPADLPAGTSVTIRATLRWMACGEQCVPGTHALRLTLPTAGEAAPHHVEKFEAWRAGLPVSAEAAGLRSVRVDPPPGTKRFEQSLRLTWGRAPRSVSWIPAHDRSIATRMLEWRQEDRVTVMRQEVRIQRPAELKSETARGLVVFEDQAGRRGVWVRFGVVPPEAP